MSIMSELLTKCYRESTDLSDVNGIRWFLNMGNVIVVRAKDQNDVSYPHFIKFKKAALDKIDKKTQIAKISDVEVEYHGINGYDSFTLNPSEFDKLKKIFVFDKSACFRQEDC